MIQIEPAGVYTAAEVAGALRRSPRWFRDNRRALMRAGFPLPCSRIGRPRWLGAHLLAWLDRGNSRDAAAPGGNVINLAARAALVAKKPARESGSRA